MVASRRAAVISAAAAVITAVSAKAPKGKTPGLSRAMTRGVPPLRLRSTCGLARRWCLPFLLANQTALTPSAKPPGKPGLRHSHLSLLSWKGPWRSGLGNSAAPPAGPRLVWPPPSAHGHSRGSMRTPAERRRQYRRRGKAHSVRRFPGRIRGEAGRAAGPGIWPGGVHRAPTTSAGARPSERQTAAMMGDQADGHALLR